MMINLPKSCLVNKFIPKKVFYEKSNINQITKEEFINIVDKIIWLYKLSPETTGINKTEDIEEIETFQIELKEKVIPKNVIKAVTNSIQYKILFVLKYNEEFCYLIKLEDVYYTNWNEEINFEFTSINLSNLYESIAKSILHEESNTKNFNEIIENINEKKELQDKIDKLTKRIKQENQFNRKVELNQELNKLLKEIGELK